MALSISIDSGKVGAQGRGEIIEPVHVDSELRAWLEGCPRDASVLLIVPSALWMREVPRIFSRAGLRSFGVRPLTPIGLARWLAEDRLQMDGRSPLGTAGAIELSRAVAVEEPDPDPFGAESRAQPGFTMALVSAISRLRLAGLTTEDLRLSTGRCAEHKHQKILGLAALYERWLEMLIEMKGYDGPEVLRAARAYLKRGGVFPEPIGGMAVIGRHMSWGWEKLLLRRLFDDAQERGSQVPTFHTPFAAPPHEGTALGIVKTHLFESTRGAGSLDETLEMLPCAGEGAEVNEALRFVLDIAVRGTPFNRQAILIPQAVPYADLIEGAISDMELELPLDQHTARSLASTHPGRALLAILDLVGTDLPADRVFELLVSGFVDYRRHPAFIGAFDDQEEARFPSTHRLQHIARRARVVSGADWEERLDHVEGVGAEGARALRRVISALAQSISTLDDVRPLSTHFKRAAELFREWGPLDRERGLVQALLDELERVPDCGLSVSWPLARQYISLALESCRAPGQSEPQGVVLADLESVAGLPFESALILGLAEGRYPTAPRPSPLLPDDLCDALGIPTEAEGAHHRRALFRDTCRSVAGSLCLTWPAVAANEDRPRVPSSFAIAVEEALFGRIREERERVVLSRLPREGQRALDATEHWLGRLLHEPIEARRALVDEFSELEPLVDLEWRRWGNQVGPWDGRVAPTLAQRAIEEIMGGMPSPTTLEVYATCPFRFFTRHLLRLEPLQEPTRQVQPEPRDVGRRVHSVLERLLVDSLGEAMAFPVFDESIKERVLQLLKEELDELAQEMNYARPARVELLREQIELPLLQVVEKMGRDTGYHPLHLELPFGMEGREGSLPGFELSLGESGGQVRVRGIIDRVDSTNDEPQRLRIVDYKTGRAPRDEDGSGKLSKRFGSGRRIQLGCYALAAEQGLGRPVNSIVYEYMALRTRDPSRQQLTWSRERAEELREVISLLVESLQSGLFAPGPECPCWNMSPLCIGTRRRAHQTQDDPLWSLWKLATGVARSADR